MGVTMQHQRHRITADWFLEAAGSEERIDFERFAFDRFLDRRVMQQRDNLIGPQPSERGFELQRFVDRLAHELFDDRFTPGTEGAFAEAAAESLDPGDANPLQLARIAVEHDESGIDENLPHLVRLSRFEIVVAEHRCHRYADRAELACEHARLVWQSVIRQIARDQQHVGGVADAGEQMLKSALRRFGAVQVGYCGQPNSPVHGSAEYKSYANVATDEPVRPEACTVLSGMPGSPPRQLGNLIVTPFATIGVLSAVLVWEVEHVGSLLLALAIFAGAAAVGIVVAKRLRADIENLTNHYEALLATADDQSRQAEAANQLKDEFLTTLSHELRTPLNSVLGWARLLASGKLDPAQTIRAIESIERAGWAQSRLIEDLLDISQIVGGKLQITTRRAAVQPLVTAAVEALRAAADAKNISIAEALDPNISPLVVDPDRIQQIAWNLISNAIKFTPNGGRVDVRLTAQNGELVLAVHDTGVGFDPQVARHLFERFRQGDSSTTRQFGGLGLGLGIVRHVVELHGGTVSATSAGENTGSTFVVRIPMRETDEPAVAPQPAMQPPSLGGVSVLVVDDDPSALEFVRRTLEQYGAFVVTAGSAKEGRDQFKREHPDVIVSDLVMAHEDGLQFIRDIRKMENPAGHVTPAAALTALARADDRRRALSAGYQMHVAKPIDPDELAVTVERLAHQNPNAVGGRQETADPVPLEH